MKTDLSVIVPVYQVEKYVGQCIESLKAQNCESFEVIIVDDGSRDSSIAICEQLIAQDSRFRIVHKKNGGLMSAWKTGLSYAKGTYVGFVDGDDWVDADMYSTLLQEIKNNDADVVSSGYVAEGLNSRTVIDRPERFEFSGTQVREEFLRAYCGLPDAPHCRPTTSRCDKIYRKELLLNNLHLFHEKVSMGEDFNTNIAVFLDAKKVILLANFAPYHYQFNPKSIVHTVNPKAFDNIAELSKVCDEIAKEKSFDVFHMDYFLGNMIVEEVSKICSSPEVGRKELKDLRERLDQSGANRYIRAYAKGRKTARVTIYSWLFRARLMRPIQWMSLFYTNKKNG